MNLKEAKQYSESFKNEFPEVLVKLGSDYQFSDKKLEETVQIAEIFWLSENISEQTAFTKALKLMIKDN